MQTKLNTKFTLYKSSTSNSMCRFIFSSGKLVIVTPTAIICTRQKVNKKTPTIDFPRPPSINHLPYIVVEDFQWFYDSKGKRKPYVRYKYKGIKTKILAAPELNSKEMSKSLVDDYLSSLPSNDANVYTDMVTPTNHRASFLVPVDTYEFVETVNNSILYTYWDKKLQIYYLGIQRGK